MEKLWQFFNIRDVSSPSNALDMHVVHMDEDAQMPYRTDEEANRAFMTALWQYLQGKVLHEHDFFRNTMVVNNTTWCLPTDHPVAILLLNWADNDANFAKPVLVSALSIWQFPIYYQSQCTQFILQLMLQYPEYSFHSKSQPLALALATGVKEEP